MGIDLTVSGETKLTGLVGGSGITSSFSPRMHTASFAEVGVDAVYLSFPITPEMLGDVVRGLQDIAVGYNVTMPYKTYICELLDGLSPAARLMGAVNTVVVKDGKSYGHNTDGAGFSENLRLHGFDPSGKKVTIVGAGDLIDQCVIDEGMLHEGLTVADTVYNPVESKLIKMAKAHGLAAYGGLGMLLQQAALAEKIWFGTDMPIELIREKLFS